MSMNLHVKFEGTEYNLRQTPTTITHMCMVQDDGSIAWDLNGRKAKRALYIYIEWVRGSLDGSWNSSEELKMAEDAMNESVEELLSLVNNSKKINVYMM